MIFVSHSIKIEFQKNIKYDGKKKVVYHGWILKSKKNYFRQEIK